jgi:hypothetical protein
VDAVQAALDPPPNLGEARHPLAGTAALHVRLGDAFAALGETAAAHAAWEHAAASTGDFVDMAEATFGRGTVDAAHALVRLGRTEDATDLVDRLEEWLAAFQGQEAEVDFFATSLPGLLLFVEDPTTTRDREAAHVRQQIQAFRKAAKLS